jgi:orotidine-5'-phosphate decarboxylase
MADVIVALDFPSANAAREMVGRLGSQADFYKVGLELYTRAGPSFVHELTDAGKRVFLDLKLHDIPKTVTGAVVAASALGVELITVHAAGGPVMLQAAARAASGDTKVVAVTVLTSLSPDDIQMVWGREIRSLREEVGRLAELAESAGVSGVVASALEASWIRGHLGENFLIVTPGIRPSGGEHGDQKRVATPTDAVLAGSDYLVVGRAVTEADDPPVALASILEEVSEASTSLT